jgi:hypothetical protein
MMVINTHTLGYFAGEQPKGWLSGSDKRLTQGFGGFQREFT